MRFLKPLNQVLGAILLVLVLTAEILAAPPKYIFYFIGDGLGASQRQLSEFFIQEKDKNPAKKLLMNTFEVAGMNTTHCANTLITDSAAAGTALASGLKTNKGVIGKDTNGKNVTTLIEAARDKGMKTGIITTTRLTHATPAAFVAHNISRYNENQIAEDMLNSNVDFLAGGGIRHFIPQGMKIENGDAVGKTIQSKRKDDKNLVNAFEKKGYKTFIGLIGARAFGKTDFSKTDKAFAAFTHTHTPFEIERRNTYPHMPSLARMARTGIELLHKGDKGFFLVIEGGRIDHACHANDPAGLVYDTLALDAAVQTAFEFYSAHRDETLIIVVGDHETGGLGLGMDRMGYRLNIKALMGARVSAGDTLAFGRGRYTGDRDLYTDFLAENYGLTSLEAHEKDLMDTAFAAADKGETMGYYEVNPTAIAAARLLSQRVNINWTATIHTATMIPMSAVGNGAQNFGGYKDNTQIAMTMAKLLNLDL